MNKHSFHPLLLILIFTTTFCHKEDSYGQLPPETQTGANTFACRVNGAVWIAKGDKQGVPMLNVDFYNATHLNVFASTKDVWCYGSNAVESITFSLRDSVKPGVFVLNDPQRRLGSYSSDIRRQYYQTDTDTASRLKITFHDANQRIICGRFELHFAANGNQPPVHITEGRFDLRY